MFSSNSTPSFSMSMPSVPVSAPDNLLYIDEILENILRVDQRTLLRAQGVNRFFYNCIQDSQPLQGHLLFRSVTPLVSGESDEAEESAARWTINPLLRSSLIPLVAIQTPDHTRTHRTLCGNYSLDLSTDPQSHLCVLVTDIGTINAFSGERVVDGPSPAHQTPPAAPAVSSHFPDQQPTTSAPSGRLFTQRQDSERAIDQDDFDYAGSEDGDGDAVAPHTGYYMQSPTGLTLGHLPDLTYHICAPRDGDRSHSGKVWVARAIHISSASSNAESGHSLATKCDLELIVVVGDVKKVAVERPVTREDLHDGKGAAAYR
ncbi:uncharacterized protein BDZ99DRAFT_476140 [Mytilinidion resinicola]|uniref:F-box domain-containing protein n=1 Tax=Mytilinidion resinicola TaxID=574789 RepID=A0A6A6YM82_9PEZI|nr:uncharacterized protein BDZ99DRAFT_476140 [Mytilinidion resinicola]KAF2809900.1 hypothetical protein BDZ99DRAFT_476140 [Mytilinidion resinicola]